MCLFRPKRAIYSANGEAGKPPKKPGVKLACIDGVALDRSTVRVERKAGRRDNTDRALGVNSPPAPMAGRLAVASYGCEYESGAKQGDRVIGNRCRATTSPDGVAPSRRKVKVCQV